MKRVINGILVILLLSLTACSKSDDEVDTGKSPIPEKLLGNWDASKIYHIVYSIKSGDIISWNLQYSLDHETFYFSFGEDGKCVKVRDMRVYPVLYYNIKDNKLIIEDEEYTIIELTDSKLTLQQVKTKYDDEFQEKVRIEDTYYFNKQGKNK